MRMFHRIFFTFMTIFCIFLLAKQPLVNASSFYLEPLLLAENNDKNNNEKNYKENEKRKTARELEQKAKAKRC